MKVYKKAIIGLEPPLWDVLELLQTILNRKLKARGKPQVNVSGIITWVLHHTLLHQASSIQHEYEQMGLDQLAVRLAPHVGADELAQAGLPEAGDLSDDRRAVARVGRRADDFFTKR